MRIREPKTTALIFSSGKMVVTGAKSETDSKLAARKYARVIQKLGYPAKFTDFKIQNIVGSCDVKFPIRLEGLAFQHGAYSSVSSSSYSLLMDGRKGKKKKKEKEKEKRKRKRKRKRKERTGRKQINEGKKLKEKQITTIHSLFKNNRQRKRQQLQPL